MLGSPRGSYPRAFIRSSMNSLISRKRSLLRGSKSGTLVSTCFGVATGFGIFFGLTGGSTDALSMMYRHNDPHMTRVYFTMLLPGQINQLSTELNARLRSSTANRTAEEQEWIDSAYVRLSYLKDHHQSFDEPRCEIFVEKLIGLWRGTRARDRRWWQGAVQRRASHCGAGHGQRPHRIESQ